MRGDALLETAEHGMNTTAWFGGYSGYPKELTPFLIRGSSANTSSLASSFGFSSDKGTGNYNQFSGRAVLVETP